MTVERVDHFIYHFLIPSTVPYLIVGADVPLDRLEHDHGHHSCQEKGDHQRVHDGEVVYLPLCKHSPTQTQGRGEWRRHQRVIDSAVFPVNFARAQRP